MILEGNWTLLHSFFFYILQEVCFMTLRAVLWSIKFLWVFDFWIILNVSISNGPWKLKQFSSCCQKYLDILSKFYMRLCHFSYNNHLNLLNHFSWYSFAPINLGSFICIYLRKFYQGYFFILLFIKIFV